MSTDSTDEFVRAMEAMVGFARLWGELVSEQMIAFGKALSNNKSEVS